MTNQIFEEKIKKLEDRILNNHLSMMEYALSKGDDGIARAKVRLAISSFDNSSPERFLKYAMCYEPAEKTHGTVMLCSAKAFEILLDYFGWLIYSNEFNINDLDFCPLKFALENMYSEYYVEPILKYHFYKKNIELVDISYALHNKCNLNIIKRLLSEVKDVNDVIKEREENYDDIPYHGHSLISAIKKMIEDYHSYEEHEKENKMAIEYYKQVIELLKEMGAKTTEELENE